MPADAGVDPLPDPPHHPVDGGQEQLALAREIAIERPLADLEPLGQGLRHRVGVAVLGEHSPSPRPGSPRDALREVFLEPLRLLPVRLLHDAISRDEPAKEILEYANVLYCWRHGVAPPLLG